MLTFIFAMAGLILVFAVTSWSVQPWGVASFIAAEVVLGGVGCALAMRKPQSH
jgi:hypothetical protein